MALQARLTITGRVQGVGYRYWAMRTGLRLGVTGWVRNRTDGSVEALIVGDDAAVGAMIDACRRGPADARVDDGRYRAGRPRGTAGRLYAASDGLTDKYSLPARSAGRWPEGPEGSWASVLMLMIPPPATRAPPHRDR